jgi:hypothetical protein
VYSIPSSSLASNSVMSVALKFGVVLEKFWNSFRVYCSLEYHFWMRSASGRSDMSGPGYVAARLLEDMVVYIVCSV